MAPIPRGSVLFRAVAPAVAALSVLAPVFTSAQTRAAPQNTSTSATASASPRQLTSREEYDLDLKPLRDARRYSEKAAGVGILVSTSPEQEKVWSAAAIGEALKLGLAKRGIENSEVFIDKAGTPSGTDKVAFMIDGEMAILSPIGELKPNNIVAKVVLAQSNAAAVQRSKSQNHQDHQFNNE